MVGLAGSASPLNCYWSRVDGVADVAGTVTNNGGIGGFGVVPGTTVGGGTIDATWGQVLVYGTVADVGGPRLVHGVTGGRGLPRAPSLLAGARGLTRGQPLVVRVALALLDLVLGLAGLV